METSQVFINMNGQKICELCVCVCIQCMYIYKKYTYNGILLSHKKGWDLTICDNVMDLEGIILSEITQTEKDKYCMISLMHGI